MREAFVGLVSLLFGFQGRINRSQYWLGTIGLNVANYVVMFIVSMSNIFAIGAQGKNPALVLSALTSQLAVVGALSLVTMWCGCALQTKRFHDRGQSGWWAALPMAPMFFIVGNIVTGIAAHWPPERMLSSMGLPVLALLVIGIGLFINLGCLPGTSGPNKYGDPPGSGLGGAFTPSPSTPIPGAPAGNGTAAAASSLFGAQSAIERAIAENARVQPATARTQAALAQVRTQPRASTPTPPAPASGAPSFGRRVR